MPKFRLGCPHGMIDTQDGFRFVHGKEGRHIFICEECNKIIIIDTTIVELPE